MISHYIFEKNFYGIPSSELINDQHADQEIEQNVVLPFPYLLQNDNASEVMPETCEKPLPFFSLTDPF